MIEICILNADVDELTLVRFGIPETVASRMLSAPFLEVLKREDASLPLYDSNQWIEVNTYYTSGNLRPTMWIKEECVTYKPKCPFC